MVKQKWYVVTVGRDIGIFPTWLEVGPLVKGVSDAVHQSFATWDEAQRMFAQQKAKGNTRIINDDPANNSRPANAYKPTTPAPSFRNDSSPRTYSPLLHVKQSKTTNGHHSAGPDVPETPVHQNTSPRITSPITRSSSEPSSRFRRLKIIQDALDENSRSVGVGARALSPKSAPASTPTVEYSSSRSTGSNFVHYHAVVETPSWLPSYPRAPQTPSQLLSPLNSADLPLNSFKINQVHQSSSPITPQILPVTNPQFQSPSRHRSPDRESISFSSIYLSPPPQANRIMHDVDPRSPILNESQVPEMGFVSPLSFTRPSPRVKREILPLDPNHNMGSSLLFKHTSTPL